MKQAGTDAAAKTPLRARRTGGGTPVLPNWGADCEYGVLRDVLLGPAETFRWLGAENAEYSSLVRDTLRKGYEFDPQLAIRKAKKIEIVPVTFRETMALGCNVMALGNERVLAPAAAKDLIGRLKAMGFKVYDPDLSMFTRAGGGVHCMAQALRRDRV